MRIAPILVIVSALSACTSIPQPSCGERVGDRAAIAAAVEAMYEALRRDDIEAFRAVTTRRFYSYDGGDRFDGVALAEFVRDARAKGMQLNWKVGRLDTQIGCNVAWSAWETSGSAGRPPAVRPVRWLESAVLIRDQGRWKIDFFHSHRKAD